MKTGSILHFKEKNLKIRQHINIRLFFLKKNTTNKRNVYMDEFVIYE